MPTVQDVYGSSGTYLSAKSVKDKQLVGKPLTIKDAKVEKIKETDENVKLILDFEENSFRLPLNKTNAMILSESFGEDYEKWAGKKLQLLITKRQFQGQLVDGIQVVGVQ